MCFTQLGQLVLYLVKNLTLSLTIESDTALQITYSDIRITKVKANISSDIIVQIIYSDIV